MTRYYCKCRCCDEYGKNREADKIMKRFNLLPYSDNTCFRFADYFVWYDEDETIVKKGILYWSVGREQRGVEITLCCNNLGEML